MARKGIYKRGETWWLSYADHTCNNVRKSSGTSNYKDTELMLYTEEKAVKEGS
jgi:hypothetical protein